MAKTRQRASRNGPCFYDNHVDISDEFPCNLQNHKMELLQRIVEDSRKQFNDWKPFEYPYEAAREAVSTSQEEDDSEIFHIRLTKSPSLSILTPRSGPETASMSSKDRKSVNFKNCPCNELRDRSLLHSFSSAESVSSDETFDSQAAGLYSDRFQVILYNKFGTLRDTASKIVDAKDICHVYKGSVLVTDHLDSKVILYERSGKAVRTFLTKKTTEPWTSVMTPDGNVAVSLRRQCCVALWYKNGQSFAELGHGFLKCPAGLAVDKAGRIIVADEFCNDIFVLDQQGCCLFKLSETGQCRFKQPRYVCCSNTGRIIVSDSGNHQIKIFDKDGQFLFQFGGYGREPGRFKFPYGVCVDQHDNIFVADHYNDRVIMFSESGEYMQDLVTAASGIKNPCGVSIRRTHNRKLYITHGGLKASEVVVYKLISLDSEVTISVKHFV